MSEGKHSDAHTCICLEQVWKVRREHVDSFSREPTLSKLFLLPTEKGSAVKGKNLPPLESYIFHLSVDTFLEGV